MQTGPIKITVPVSHRIYKAFQSDFGDAMHSELTEEERDWWTKLAAKMERRMKHLKGEKRKYRPRGEQ